MNKAIIITVNMAFILFEVLGIRAILDHEKEHPEYCTRYKQVVRYEYSPSRSNNPPFYIEFSDGTGAELYAKEGNYPAIGHPLCVEYKKI